MVQNESGTILRQTSVHDRYDKLFRTRFYGKLTALCDVRLWPAYTAAATAPADVGLFHIVGMGPSVKLLRALQAVLTSVSGGPMLVSAFIAEEVARSERAVGGDDDCC